MLVCSYNRSIIFLETEVFPFNFLYRRCTNCKSESDVKDVQAFYTVGMVFYLLVGNAGWKVRKYKGSDRPVTGHWLISN